jgi:hypothetical protein
MRRPLMSQSDKDAICQAFHEAARRAVALAVKKDSLAVPKSCELCGSKGRLEAHHHRGYDVLNWLDIRWLCKACHQTATALERECECLVCSLGAQ